MHVGNPQIGADVSKMIVQEAHYLAKRIRYISPSVQDQCGQMFERRGKRLAFIEHGPEMLTKDHNLFNNRILMRFEEFIQYLMLFEGHVLLVREQYVAVLP